LPIFGFSQAPQKINFQSILRNTNGEVVANKAVSLRISILSGSLTSTLVYSEIHTKTTDASGLISLQIGNGTVINGAFSNILWGNEAHFIKLEADFNGGSNYVLLGTQELMSVPYALYASKTDTSSLNLANRFNSKVNISDTATMLTNYRNELNNKVNTSDTFFMLSNYWTGLNNKVNISDTSTMLNPYLRKVDAVVNIETDPVFNSSIAKGISGIDTAYWNRKINPSDTSSMLSNYRTGLTNKVNVSDTSSMLNPYLRKTDDVIVDLQNQNKILQNLAKVTDADGNSYKTVKIGNQIWMAENLRTSKYQNGNSINTNLDDLSWSTATSGAFAIYENNPTFDTSYGKLYNWYAVSDNRGICPTGWHVPSQSDFITLREYLGGASVAGGKLKLTGTTFWLNPNINATNESGFSAVGGGTRNSGGSYTVLNQIGFFWSSTENLEFDVVNNGGGTGLSVVSFKTIGYSVRCLKDTQGDFNQSLNLKLNISDTSTMLNPYLRKVDAMVNVETDPVFNTSIAKGISGIDTAYWNRKINPSDTATMLNPYLKKADIPVGTSPGNIQYWNGTTWVNLSPGLPGQVISMSSTGIPIWSGAAFPTLTTASVSSITSTSANPGGNISSDGGASVSARGLVYGIASNPTLSNSVMTVGSGTGGYAGTISGLTPNTTYYVRAYSTNSAGTGYGNEISFQTLPIAVPTLVTTDASGITQTTVTTGGTISNDGGATITERGIVYGTSSNPTTSDTKLTSGSGTGSFSVNITALTPITTYYIRSYAINSAGTGYGNNIIFQTTVPAVPSLTTRELLNITNATATGGGSITNDGGSSITAKGICWGTSPNPTTADSKTTDGTGTTTFTSFMTGLSANVTYYVRAYASNSTGTGYGNQQTFTTSSTSNTLPVVTSTSVTGLTTVQATLNGEVNSQGGGTVTERGSVWNTSGNPTVNSNQVPSGAGTGVYTTTLTGLSAVSNYYVRAYAINNFGISYGVEIPFTTLVGLATLTTDNVIAQSITASSGGNITDNGGSTITARGVVWNISGTPTISDSKTTAGSGTGSFVSNMTALSPNTTYYVRAYATNSTGTAYGNQQTFTTTATSQTAIDIDGNNYKAVQIGTQVWMSENLKTSRYRNGGSIPYVVGNAGWQALTTGAWSYYNHDESNNAVYGKLYNWFTTLGDTLCPTGWHVPSDAEWTTLTTYLGGVSVAGGRMKSIGTTYWNSPNTGATNESGFSVLPGGGRYNNGSFFSIGVNAYLWSSSENSYFNDGYGRGLSYNNGNVESFGPYDGYDNKSVGYSIRCLKDQLPSPTTTSINQISPTGASSGGNITALGSSIITARGVVWNTTGTPTISDSKTIDGSGSGSYVSNLAALNPSTTYYVRAYATNSTGMGYGNEISFQTLPIAVPTLITTDVSGITQTTVTTGGTISNDGGVTITERGIVFGTSTNPTTSNTKITSGSGSFSFSINITSLTPNTTYYIRSYAINGVGTGYGNQQSFRTVNSQTITDIDGNNYNTVQIGSQIWMSENLKTTRYSGGASAAWTYYNNVESNNTIYGKLYDGWTALDARGICPTGWHVPSDSEWTTLTTYLGGGNDAGGKMKSMGLAYWSSPNTAATNESGFSALPGGFHNHIVAFNYFGTQAYFWSSSGLAANTAWFRVLDYNTGNIYRNGDNNGYGLSIRCLKD